MDKVAPGGQQKRPDPGTRGAAKAFDSTFGSTETAGIHRVSR